MKKTLFIFMIFLLILLPLSGEATEPRIDYGWAMLLDIFPGFGVGSFIQGDYKCGAAQLLAEGLGWGWFLFWGAQSKYAQREAGHVEAGLMGAMISGLAIYPWAAGYLLGLIGPPWYENKYRMEHRNKEVSIGFAPSITPSADRREQCIGMQLMIRYAIK